MRDDRSRQPLLFIVRDATNLRKTAAEAKAITAHVAARHRKWRKVVRVPSLHESTKAILIHNSSVPPSPSSKDDKAIHQGYHKTIARIEKQRRDLVRSIEDLKLAPSIHCYLYQDDREDFWDMFYHLLEPDLLSPGGTFFDPFTPSSVHFDFEIRSALHLYFKVLHPFARSLISSWVWFDDISRIQATPALAYAIAAYTTGFFTGLRTGGPGVVLPPPAKPGKDPLWPVPRWLRLQTKCLTELNLLLSDPAKTSDIEAYHTILFLYRFSVLLGDGHTARMHRKALDQMSQLSGMKSLDLDLETAVSKVNIVSAFFHKPSVVVIRKRSKRLPTKETITVDVDRRHWKSHAEWKKFQGGLTGRVLCWRAESPGSVVQPETAPAIAHMDPESIFLEGSVACDIQRCYQIALYLITYLNGISLNPSAPQIRSNLLDLQQRLSCLDTDIMMLKCPNTTFNLLLAGALGSRDFPESVWFTARLARDYPEIQYLNQVYELLGLFTDTWGIRASLIRDIWADVLGARAIASKDLGTTRSRLNCRTDTPNIGMNELRPCTYSPDVEAPVETIIEIED